MRNRYYTARTRDVLIQTMAKLAQSAERAARAMKRFASALGGVNHRQLRVDTGSFASARAAHQYGLSLLGRRRGY